MPEPQAPAESPAARKRRARAARVFAALPTRPRGADLVDFRDPSEHVLAHGAKLGDTARRALAKHGRAVA